MSASLLINLRADRRSQLVGGAVLLLARLCPSFLALLSLPSLGQVGLSLLLDQGEALVSSCAALQVPEVGRVQVDVAPLFLARFWRLLSTLCRQLSGRLGIRLSA